MSTQALVPKDFQRWKQDLRDVCGPFDARRSAVDHHFYGSAERLTFGDLELARVQSNAASIARARCHDAHASPYCFLVLQLQGRQHLAVDRLEPVEMRPGDLMLLDPEYPFEMLPHGFVENISVHLPRPLLRQHLPGQQLTARLAGDSVSVQVLGALIRQVVCAAPIQRARPGEAQALREAMIALLPPALRQVASLDAPEEGLYLAAMRQIEANLASFDLTPDWLAHRLHVSRRHLYRAFAAEGAPGVAQAILSRRLERAAELFKQGGARAATVGIVSMEVGIADLAHFSRAFRRRFALTPSQFRAREHA